jgi:hypothetical protein
MTRKTRRPAQTPAPGIVPIYEGPEVLGALLQKAGSPFDVGEVAARFAAAIAAGERRAAVIPSLFEDEPHFDAPEDARRLYGNLFGLWGRIEEGRGPHDDAPEVVAEPPVPELPERGTASGITPPSDIVEGMWRWIAAAAPRALQRLRDRYANTQPELSAWLEEQAVAPRAWVPMQELAFEAWAMFDHAYADRLGVAGWPALRELQREPPPLEADHPALAAYVSEQLENLADEDDAFGAEERAQVERAIASVAAALAGALRQPS